MFFFDQLKTIFSGKFRISHTNSSTNNTVKNNQGVVTIQIMLQRKKRKSPCPRMKKTSFCVLLRVVKLQLSVMNPVESQEPPLWGTTLLILCRKMLSCRI